jgi:mannose-6-phosphate isomerase-like protein (cupin superfamily)
MDGYVVAASELEETKPAPEDTAHVRFTIGPGEGCQRLEQRIVRFAAGRSRPQALDGLQAVLYVVSGTGRLVVGQGEEELTPLTGAYVASGESFVVENHGADDLVAVLVTAPVDDSVAPRDGRTVRWQDRPSLPASPDREFRFLVNEDVGCRDITQFVGLIPPGRAPMHSHAYDEVIYVIAARRRSPAARASTCRPSSSTASKTEAKRPCRCSGSSTRPGAPPRARPSRPNKACRAAMRGR